MTRLTMTANEKLPMADHNYYTFPSIQVSYAYAPFGQIAVSRSHDLLTQSLESCHRVGVSVILVLQEVVKNGQVYTMEQ